VYHKYGNLNNNLHDVAVIIYNGRTYVLAIYTRSNGLAGLYAEYGTDPQDYPGGHRFVPKTAL